MDLTNKKNYFYHLPKELIAQYPQKNRSESHLMVLNKNTGEISHSVFKNILDYLKEDDIVVLNKTKVIPARLHGKKSSGAKVEIFLLNQISPLRWECLVNPGKKLQPGVEIIFSEEFSAKIIDYSADSARIVEFYYEGDFWEVLEKFGKMPLPPYIKREATLRDKITYQTVFAKERGSVAAPTAGLHFTHKLIEKAKQKNIRFLELTLHVGLGTFRPVKTENILDHKMHSEFCSIPPQVAAEINLAKRKNHRIISVGTTTTRALESFAEDGILRSGSHWTDIFIYPPQKLQIIDGLITNFHMPESTLLMLVSAFAGYQNIMKAYEIAVQERYRFFSYGDSMFIV